ncbi:MAG: RNase adapter RapZ [Eggerthellaceae bacterium]|nr:RNase adapter RapZ [Eggerthellaceae bacterium]
MKECSIAKKEWLVGMPKLIIVTGMSGAGRTEAMHFFEDLGYFCIDNLPSPLLENLVELKKLSGNNNKDTHIAVICDARNQEYFADLMTQIKKLDSSNVNYQILFLDANNETLVARYKASRRLHPMSMDFESISQAVEKERALIFDLKEQANHIVDTSELPPNGLKNKIRTLFSTGQLKDGLNITVYSFGFKYGAPEDSDIVMDVRYLPNPYWTEELRKQTGLDEDVRKFVLFRPESEEFVAKWRSLLDTLIPGYISEGKQHLAISIGCTGGQHRSVCIAEDTGNYLKSKGYRVSITHRNIDRAKR